jgi:hypothetical protein
MVYGVKFRFLPGMAPGHMPLLFVLEDNPADLRKAADLAKPGGFTEFDVIGYQTEAQKCLEKALSAKAPLSDAIVTDLS